MRNKKLFTCYLSCLFLFTGTFAKEVKNIENVTSSLTLSTKVDYHITGNTGCIAPGVTINLTHEEAWLFFDNVEPSEVIQKWLPQIKQNGNTLTAQETAWVSIYKHGTVIIPQNKNYEPLSVYTGEVYGGESKSYKLGKYISLGNFDNNIKSFKLKRGYMATFAQSRDGSGYSRCFIAQDQDIEIPNLSDKECCTNGGALYNKISFIRVMRLQMPGKKGSIWDGDSKTLDCDWFYNYDCGFSTDPNREFVPMFHHVGWNSFAAAGSTPEISGTTHTLGFNEPWNSADKGYMGTDPLAPIPYQSDAVKTGHRIGSMAPTDGNFGKLYAFMDECDRLGLRCDFVAVHIYQLHDADWWYNKTKEIYQRTGRPVWITEFNNGANWTGEWWPGTLDEQWDRQRRLLSDACAKLNEAPWVERYAIYNAVQLKRNVISQADTVATIDGITKRYKAGDLTPAGENYKAMKTGLAYNPDCEFIPVYPQFKEPETVIGTSLMMTLGRISFTIKEENGEYFDSYKIEKKTGDGIYEILKEGTAPSFIDTWDKENPQNISYRVSYYYCNETTPRYTMEESLGISASRKGPIQYGTINLSKPDWFYTLFDPFSEGKALPILGGASEKCTLGGEENQFTASVYPVIGSNNFRTKLSPWGYLYDYQADKLNDLKFEKSATIPFVLVDTTATTLQNLPVEAGIINRINEEWKQIHFKKTFEETPVVFTSLLSNNNFSTNSAPVYPLIRNVTPEGFEICITRESKLGNIAWSSQGENIGYYAVTPGEISLPNDNRLLHIVVARTPVQNGSSIQTTYTEFPMTCSEIPTVIASMQTCNDNNTSTLVYSNLDESKIRFYRMREKSTSSSTICSKEAVGYMLLYSSDPNGMETLQKENQNIQIYEQDGKLFTTGIQGNRISIYTTDGIKILSADTENGIETNTLPCGYYLLRSNLGESVQFLKK